jgi:ABC-type multidrug transport system permease subunit
MRVDSTGGRWRVGDIDIVIRLFLIFVVVFVLVLLVMMPICDYMQSC